MYSCGSLWTSIVPCLALRGVASAIAKSTTLRAKVLLRGCSTYSNSLPEPLLIASCPLSSVNSNNDRETDGYTAVDYVSTIVRTLNESKRSKRGNSGEIMMPGIKTKTRRSYETNRLITHLVYLERGKVEVDLEHLQVSRSRLQVGHYGTHHFVVDLPGPGCDRYQSTSRSRTEIYHTNRSMGNAAGQSSRLGVSCHAGRETVVLFPNSRRRKSEMDRLYRRLVIGYIDQRCNRDLVKSVPRQGLQFYDEIGCVNRRIITHDLTTADDDVVVQEP